MRKLARSKMVITVVLLLVSFSLNGPLFAGGSDETTNALLERIMALEKKVEDLNKKLEINASVEAAKISDELVQKKVEAVLKQKEATEGGLLKAVKDVNVSGFVDTSYTYTFGSPDSRVNAARVFDTEANNFNVQAAEVVLEKLPPEEGGVGFRTDLYFGQDAEVITPTGSTRDQFDLEQAYIQLKPNGFKLPIGDWQWIKMGKFVTMHGAEVIESKDNLNFTRSLLFGYAIPFTHTGIRAGYQLTDSLAGYLGVNNGWDNVKDNNHSKSLESALSWTASDKLSFCLAGMYGPEQASNDHSQRGLIDFLATYKPFNKWTFILNADYGHDEDAITAGKDGAWSGVAAYLKYEANNWLSFISRTEFFSDRQGLRVVAGTMQDLWETTFTIDVRPYKDLITRLEYRHDGASSNVFSRNQKVRDRQDTLGLEMIYSF